MLNSYIREPIHPCQRVQFCIPFRADDTGRPAAAGPPQAQPQGPVPLTWVRFPDADRKSLPPHVNRLCRCFLGIRHILRGKRQDTYVLPFRKPL